MNPELLSRLQFAFTASFHFIYPPISMGLGLLLVVIGVIYVRTKDPKWRQLSFFWVKVYGLVFAMGVATGLVQEFEFGTNWADYSRFVGNIFGSLLAAEGIFAFFLEGGFLGLMLFGGNRLGPRMWLLASFMVVFGAHFSALWIIMANSWMQTPAGYELAQTLDRHARLHDELQGGRLHAVVHPAHPAHLGGLVDGGRFARAQRERVLRAEGPVCRAGQGGVQGGAADLCRVQHPAGPGVRRDAGRRGDRLPAGQAGGDGRPLGRPSRVRRCTSSAG